ncbi:hypothetical protein [Rhodopila sp.]
MDAESHLPVRPLNAEAKRRRRGRSLAILVVLLSLCGLFYAITIVKMAHF